MQGIIPRSVREFFPGTKPVFPKCMKPGQALDQIDQVAIVTNDIDSMMNYLAGNFGWGPFYVINGVKARAGRQGEQGDYRLKIAFVQVGPLEIELVQPLEGETPYQEHLIKHGAGLFHLRIGTDDIESALRHLADQGTVSAWECWDQGIRVCAHTNSHQASGIRTELVLSTEGLLQAEFDNEGAPRAVTIET